MHDSWKKSKPAGSFKSRSKGNSSADNGSAKPHGVARVISKRGYCSRSQAEKLVREGRVMLRGKIVTNPEVPTFEDDEISVDGRAVTASNFIYFMMNKPRGYVTTANDEQGRATVMDLFNEQFAKMFPGKPVPHISPVGRLDAASEGLLLFTNDTEWANRLLERNFVATDERKIVDSRKLEVDRNNGASREDELDKRREVSKADPDFRQDDEERSARDDEAQGAKHVKIYRVQVAGHPTAEHLSQMEKGFNVPPRVFGEPDEFMHTVSAKLHSAGEKNCWLEIVLDEGKNREIRRMLAHLGFEVMRLVRIKFCDYELGNLKSGEILQIKN